jgi:Xaa-Pro aminopeptidase
MSFKSDTKLRISQLRKALKQQKFEGFFVPRTDEYQGEYVPASAERLKWLTGFSGSWGTALITQKSAALIVDGRYTIQAAKEAPGFEYLAPDNPALVTFLKKTMKPGSTLGFDPWTASISETQRLKKTVEQAGLRLVGSKTNPVDSIWEDRPTAPAAAITQHPLAVAGKSIDAKLEQIAAYLKSQNCGAAVLSDPHSVAWALNIRGNDIDHTPIALLRAIVLSNGKTTVFADKARFQSSVLASFKSKVTLRKPEEFAKALTTLPKNHRPMLLDPANCPEAIRLILEKAKVEVKLAQDPCVLPRACKNPVEQKGARNAQLRDGAALSNFLHWLSNAAPAGALTERAAQDQLYKFRQDTGKLRDLSFGSISASGPNAASPHYHVTGKHGRTLRNGEIYLIDSGGQYQDGTTDVTRTVIIGQPTANMKRHNTLVLKGMIAVSVAKFPAGTTGAQIDALARAALWQQGFDFDHGTGHGVGSYLSVHEGPARISKAGHVALEPGMILSNEPGYYLKGKYGIRIENLLLVNKPAKPRGGDRKMLSFETLTFAPIDKNLIDESLMTRSEIQWLDHYHSEVWRKLNTRVSVEAKPWLEIACAPLTKHI